MAIGADKQSFEQRSLTLTARGDLVCERQTHQGQTWWIVKDPLSLRYFRLREEQYGVLQLLDGRISPAGVKQAIESRFSQLRVTYPELQSLLGMLHRNGLVVSQAVGQGEHLLTRHREQARREWTGRLLSILWIRLPGVDPDRFLQWLHGRCRWLFRPGCVMLVVMMALTALLLVVVHYDEFLDKLPAFHEFFAARNVFWLMLALACTKILHEIGHGLMCKHFGGECHQIGLMLLVFTPCLYCDTSDSWMLRSRWQRAAVGAGGMYFELMLASICTFVWWYSLPGLVHYLALNVMFICSVSTLLINCNPLLRYDGYYILSDLLEIPNLNQKARTAMIGSLREICLGLPWKPQAVVPARQRLLFVLYAIAAPIYRWMVVLMILWFLTEVFTPYGLESMGRLLLATSVVGMVAMPLWQIYSYFRVPGRLYQVKRMRLTVTLLLLAIAVLGTAVIPLPRKVITTAVIQPRDAQRVYVSVAGSLEQTDVRPGQSVSAGQTLAVLNNADLELSVIRQQGQKARLQAQLQNLRRQQNDDPGVAELIPPTEESLADVEQRLTQLIRDQQRLTLTSNKVGRVIPPPDRESPQPEGGALTTWRKTPLLPANRGAWLETGTLFCLVGTPESMEAVLQIEQSDVEFVRPGQLVEIKLDEYPTQTWQAKIAEVAKIESDFSARPLSPPDGDALASDEEAGNDRPLHGSYQARVPLDNNDERLQSGFRGRAKIHTDSSPLGERLWRLLVSLIRIKS